MVNPYIRAKSFYNKVKVYKLAAPATLQAGLDREKTLVGSLYYAQPEDIELFKFDLEGEDTRTKSFIFFRDNSFFSLDDFSNIILEFEDKNYKGNYAIDKVKRMGRISYYRVYLKRA